MQVAILYATQYMSCIQASKILDAIEPLQVIQFRARVGYDRYNDRPHAILNEVLSVRPDDPELEAKAARLKVPVLRQSSNFGNLTFDRAYDTWNGEIRLGDAVVHLRFSADTEAVALASLACGDDVWRKRVSWTRMVRAYLEQEIVPIANEWSEDLNRTVNVSELCDEIRLEDATFFDEDRFSLIFECGEIFGDHGLELSCSREQGVTDFSVFG